MMLWAFLATAVSGALAYYTWNLRTEHQTLKGTAHECGRTAKQQALHLASLTEKGVACEAARAELAPAASELAATKGELENLRKQKAEAAKQLEAFNQMREKLQKVISAGTLGLLVRDGRLIVRLSEDVLYPSGRADLSRDGELALMEVALAIRQFPDRRFMVAGHTDNKPISQNLAYVDNWELSTQRALTVARFLTEAKIKPQNLVVAGYGEHDPIADNASTRGRSENRRIEIILLPDLSELPAFAQPADKPPATAKTQ